jgi:hypothetical protein
LALEILGALDVEKGLYVTGHHLNKNNVWIPFKKGYVKFKTPKELEAGLNNEYQLLLDAKSHSFRRADSQDIF